MTLWATLKKPVGPWFGIALVVLGLIAGSIAGYQDLDKAGCISHTRTVNLFMKEDWLIGESRTCTGAYSGTHFAFGSNQTPELVTIICTDEASVLNDEPHSLPIKFWGRVTRIGINNGDVAWSQWKCRRETDGFTCRALN